MERFDLLVVGGGINGTAIARDAAGRGLSVLLVERDDLAAHTSSASSKLIHGGLRYLEYYEFGLVRKGLMERAVLLRTAPHIVQPLAFVLPWARGMRPWWMVRVGLWLYDLLALGGGLARSRAVRKSDAAFREPLRPGIGPALSYWDAKVDDARLVVLNAVDAARHGAEIATRTELISARREGDRWHASLSDGRSIDAGAIVNAAGPWVADVLSGRLCEHAESKVRLIKGSHIVVPRLYDGDHAYILQQPDGRVVFAIPYEGRFTLIGTTDLPVDSTEEPKITREERDYLCAAANIYFATRTEPGDIVWSYAGIRALHDDGAPDAKAVTRDYRLERDDDPGAPLLSVFGGKITTARALAEEALAKIGVGKPSWTAVKPLPGGAIADFELFAKSFSARHHWLPPATALRLARAYGTLADDVIGDAKSLADLGRGFGAGLSEAEIAYLVTNEYARSADDILWRRTKLGLHIDSAEREAIEAHLDVIKLSA